MSLHELLTKASFLIFFSIHEITDGKEQKYTHIVHMDKHNMPSGFVNHKQWYHTTLKTVFSASAAMEYTYDTVIHGYSTLLTPDEAKSLEKKPGVLQVQQEHTYELHTTRSPGFLGIDKIDAMFSKLNISGENVIIGLLDTGVWPESRSYNDAGIGPIPCTWKGECVSAPNFNSSDCNRKLIGAKYFSKGYEALSMDEKRELTKSPRDDDGHGTNTSTIAAGSPVDGADLFGYASGRSRGVAMYKVCWSQHCAYSDVLAAMEAAIEDGVNIISISIGGTPVDYHQDFIAEGAFIALSRGIFVACSAGSFTPLAYAFDVTYSGLIYCKPGTMIPEKVAGKIVLCDKK